MNLSLIFVSTLIFVSKPDPSWLRKVYQEIPQKMNFETGTATGKQDVSFDFSLTDGAPTKGPTSSLEIERYQLKKGSKMVVGGKEIPLFCTTALTAYTSEDDFKIVQINLLANYDACQAKEITLYSNTGVEFVYNTKKKSQVLSPKFHMGRTSFFAKPKN